MTASFRRMTPDDRAFVISMWSSSYRMSEVAGLISMDTWAEVMHREIGRIIDHPLVATQVAYEPDEHDHLGRDFLYGFITYALSSRVPYVYYVGVKSPYRRARERHGLRAGFATQLFAAAGINPRAPFRYACSTPYVSELGLKIPLAEFDPLPARFLRTHVSTSTEDREQARATNGSGPAREG